MKTPTVAQAQVISELESTGFEDCKPRGHYNDSMVFMNRIDGEIETWIRINSDGSVHIHSEVHVKESQFLEFERFSGDPAALENHISHNEGAVIAWIS